MKTNDKLQPSILSEYISEPNIDPTTRRNPWLPGFWQRFPWQGLFAVLGATASLTASIAILYLSDGVPLSAWTFQPTVYLAITSAITNILLHFSLAEAVNVAWWREALRDGTTIADLHRTWEFGNSFKAAVASWRHVNFVAITCVLVTLAPVNGPMLQRASSVVVIEQTLSSSIQGRLATQVPAGYTAFQSGRKSNPSIFTQDFGPLVQQWNQGTPISFEGTMCTGVCRARFRGAGMAVNCSLSTIPYDLVPPLDLINSSIVVQGQEIFRSDFMWAFTEPSNMSLMISIKSNSACSGVLSTQTCSFQQAEVEYPVIINGNASTVRLDTSSSTVFDDKVIHIVTDADAQSEFQTSIGPNTYGGIWLALKNRYNSIAVTRFTGAAGYTLNTTGTLVPQYVYYNSSSDYQGIGIGSSCEIAFTDPTPDMLAGVRDLMFRLSVAAVNTSTAIQRVGAQDVVTLAVYKSNFSYLAAALLFTSAAIVFVTITFHGFWSMGRKSTLSPVETAKAFGPVLRGIDGNAEVEDVVRAVGEKRVQYGAVAAIERTILGKAGERVTIRVEDISSNMHLLIVDEEKIVKPRKGWTFSD